MKKYILLLLFLAGAVFGVQAQEITVEDIVKKANEAAYYAGKDGLSDVNMTIIDSQGRERVREFRILRFNVGNDSDQKFYVYFKKPADVSKMSYMVWKHLGNDDDRWLYLPALDLVKRIAASDKRSSFVGSHFVYEDVSGRNIEDDVHTLVETTDRFYKLDNVPKDDKGLEFTHYFLWIDKVNFLPVKAEYYRGDQLVRRIKALEIKEVQGYPTVIKSEAEDLERKGKTVMEFSNVQYDVGLTEDIFAERYLRKAPAQWIN